MPFPRLASFGQSLLSGANRFANGPSMPGLNPAEDEAAKERHKAAMMATLLQATQPSDMPQSGLAAIGGAVQNGMAVKDRYGADMIRAKLYEAQTKAYSEPQFGDAKSTANILDYQQAKADGYAGSFTDYLKEFQGREAARPAQILEHEYYLGLPNDKARAEYLARLRAGQMADIGGVPNVIPPGVGAGIDQPRPLSTLATESTAAARIAGDEQAATSRSAARVKVETEVPGDIATLDEQIRKTTDVLNRFKRGDFQTGPIAGTLPAMTTAGQDLESYIGEDVLQRLSQATFGALSEGERDFLRRSGMNRGNTEAANVSILERRLTSLENAKRIASERLARAQRGEVTEEPTGGSTVSQRTEAPPAALDYLRQHPEAKDQFRAKYGYLP